MTASGQPHPSDRFTRLGDLVWRSGPDRVLLQRIAGPPETAAMDLMGDIAYVWLALDTPATTDELTERLADAGITVADLAADLRYLDAHDLITATPEGDDRSG